MSDGGRASADVWFTSQDGLVTMHDVMDAQWVLDNNRDGEPVELFLSHVRLCGIIMYRVLHAKGCQTSGGTTYSA